MLSAITKVFNDGAFSEDATFLVRPVVYLPYLRKLMKEQLSDWLSHVPVEGKEFFT